MRRQILPASAELALVAISCEDELSPLAVRGRPPPRLALGSAWLGRREHGPGHWPVSPFWYEHGRLLVSHLPARAERAGQTKPGLRAQTRHRRQTPEGPARPTIVWSQALRAVFPGPVMAGLQRRETGRGSPLSKRSLLYISQLGGKSWHVGKWGAYFEGTYTLFPK